MRADEARTWQKCGEVAHGFALSPTEQVPLEVGGMDADSEWEKTAVRN